MSQSPTEEVSENRAVNYVNAINALDRLIKSGKSLSGRERHCCFLNTGTERFANISAPSGLDFLDDGRGVAVTDWDQDGDLDLWIANRSGPQLRFLRNDVRTENDYVSLRLVGRTVNRDGIGARVEVLSSGERGAVSEELDGPSGGATVPNSALVMTLPAGDGYLSQSSKWLHFGLPAGTQVERVVVHWPGGEREEFGGVRAGGRFRLTQGTEQAELWPTRVGDVSLTATPVELPEDSERLRSFLAARIPAPLIRYHDFSGEQIELDRDPGGPVLLNFWASWCQPCLAELSELARGEDQLRAGGLNVLALSVDGLGENKSIDPARLKKLLAELNYPFDAGQADARLVDKLELLYSELFSRQVALPVPSSFLIDSRGALAAVYLGPVNLDQLLGDLKNLNADPAELRRLAVPFPGRWYSAPRSVELAQIASRYAVAGYAEDAIPLYRSIFQHDPNSAHAHNMLGISLFELDDHEQAERHYREALRLNPELVDAQYNLGLVLARRGKTEAAIANYRAAIRLSPDYFDAHWGLAMVLELDKQFEEASVAYSEAVRIKPRDPSLRRRLGICLVRQGQPEQAVTHFREAVRLEPDDAETHNDLAAALLQVGQPAEAIVHFRRTLELRPGWSSVINNLAWILATSDDSEVRDPAEAVRLAEQLSRGTADPPFYVLDTLAAAYAATRRYEKAVETVERAIDAASRSRRADEDLVRQLRDRLSLYQQGQPYREAADP